jgi:tRNA-2-methylthio-N6-dimethylallyladenosine synthase
LKLIERKVSLERLELVQRELFNYQLEKNRSLKNKVINVLVENKTNKSIKFFGRSEYMTPVIFDGNDEDVGKIIKVKITNSNRNTLFGERVEKLNLRVA